MKKRVIFFYLNPNNVLDQSDSASNEEAEQVEVDVNNESYYEKIKSNKNL